VQDFALHVDFTSDAIHLGPFNDRERAVNLLNALRVGARMVLDMGDAELEGNLYRSEGGDYWALIYDPMPGGSGFLPLMLGYWRPICTRAREALEACPSKCETACYSCLKHFRNQQWHDILNRHQAMAVLDEVSQDLKQSTTIPQLVLQPRIQAELTDSNAELTFAEVCRKRNFPVPPEAQFRVNLSGAEVTIADWAYPDHKVLVFIDGMSRQIHGNPDQQRKDKLKRAKAKAAGFRVLELTAEELSDDEMLAFKLEELGGWLEDGRFSR
jgi:hypothetical protein